MLEGGCSEWSLCWARMPLSWDLWTKTHSQIYLLTLSRTKIRAVALKNWHFKKCASRSESWWWKERVFPLNDFFFFFFPHRAIIYPGEQLCEHGPLTLVLSSLKRKSKMLKPFSGKFLLTPLRPTFLPLIAQRRLNLVQEGEISIPPFMYSSWLT